MTFHSAVIYSVKQISPCSTHDVNIVTQISPYLQLIRFDKPIGTLLLLWPTMSALWIATNGKPTWHLVLVFALGTFLMRSAGCAINDIADRDIDGQVKRTASRPLVTGVITVNKALSVAAALALLAFALVLSTNGLTMALSVAALAIACAYPYTKRWLAVPQAYLGVAFSFGIPMAFAAANNGVPLAAWLLLLGNLVWVIAYDTEYAMVDRDDDIRLNIHTSAITFGRADVAIVMACYALHFAVWVLLVWGLSVEGFTSLRTPWFAAGLLVAVIISGYHYRLIRERERMACFKAFLHNHWLGFAIFCGVAASYAMQ
jgi:4-hydroxybenzoate polyprenyltransferase